MSDAANTCFLAVTSVIASREGETMGPALSKKSVVQFLGCGERWVML